MALGYKQVALFLSPEAVKRLAELAKVYGSRVKAIEALLKAADAKPAVPPSPVPVADKAKPARQGEKSEQGREHVEAPRRLSRGRANPKPGK